MTSPHWERLKDLFAAAASIAPSEREAYLRAQGAEETLVQEVLELLAAHPPSIGVGADASATAETPAEALSAPALERVGSRIGPYRLLERIGEGGFGVVFVAEQEQPIRRRVALKVIKPGMDSAQVVARFEQERQALALMDHPFIARVLDGGATPGGRPFFVMELVKGDPITDYCDRERLSTAERLALFADVGRAVQHAHLKGVIHRDLKPSNVLVTLVDGRAVPKVIDFGVAKATQGRLTERTIYTELRQMLGTPLYMSPEQAHISGVDVDTRSDVYSLGVLLYELLTGTTPFRREELLHAGLHEMHRVLREVEPPKPSTRVATLGKSGGSVAAQRRVELARLGSLLQGDLDWIVMKCLEKERGRRYETASDLVRDVERHLEGLAISAAPPSIVYRLRKFVRRRKAQVAAGTAVALVASAGLAAFVWSEQRRADREQQHAADAQRFATERELDAYIAHIQAADAALANHDVRTVRANLDACPEHLRHWEWRYLDAASDRSEFVLEGHTAPVRFVAYDASGDRLVTASDDGTARLWDPRKGGARGVLAHGAGVRKAQFHPDGRWVATATTAGEVAVWDTASLAKVATLIAARAESASSDFAWSADGQQLATIVRGGPVTLWSCGAWQQGRELEAESQHDQVLFAPELPRLVTWSANYAPVLWDAETNRKLSELDGLGSTIQALWYRDATEALEVVTFGGEITRWNVSSGEQWNSGPYSKSRVHPSSVAWISSDDRGSVVVEDDLGFQDLLFGHRSTLVFACQMKDATQTVTASTDGTARLWSQGQTIGLFLGHTSPLTNAALHPEEHQLATVSEDHTCRLWNLKHTWEQRRAIPASETIDGFDFSPDSSQLFARSRHTCQVADLVVCAIMGIRRASLPLGYAAWCGNETLACGPSVQFLDPHGMGVRGETADEATNLIMQDAVGSPTHFAVRNLSEFKVFEARTGAQVALPPNLTRGLVDDTLGPLPARGDLDPAQPRIVVARQDGSIELRSLADGALVGAVTPRRGKITALRFRPDGLQFFVATTDGLEIFDTATCALSVQLPAGAHHEPRWSRNGAHIASASPIAVRVFDARTGEELGTIPTPPRNLGIGIDMFGPQVTFDLSADGERVLIIPKDDDRAAILWHVRSRRELLKLRTTRAESSRQVRFSPDGSMVALVSGTNITLWDATRLSRRLADAGPLLAEISAAGSASTTGDPDVTERCAAILAEQTRADLLTEAAECWAVMSSICARTATTAEIDRCLTALRKAHAAAPEERSVQYLLGIVSYHVAAYDEAARLVAASTEGSEDWMQEVGVPQPAHFSYLTMAHARSGRLEQARQALERLLEFDLDDLSKGDFGLTGQEFLRQAQTVYAECFPDAPLPQPKGK